MELRNFREVSRVLYLAGKSERGCYFADVSDVMVAIDELIQKGLDRVVTTNLGLEPRNLQLGVKCKHRKLAR